MKLGLEIENSDPIINKVTRYKGELYTAISNDALGYPILCKIEDNVLVPFAVCPEPMTYEFRYYISDDGIFAMYRPPTVAGRRESSERTRRSTASVSAHTAYVASWKSATVPPEQEL